MLDDVRFAVRCCHRAARSLSETWGQITRGYGYSLEVQAAVVAEWARVTNQAPQDVLKLPVNWDV